jgi:hypothetical protein
LQKNNISYPDIAKKDYLLALCKQHFKGPVYAVDQIIHAAGHDVIRLPPYYCIFNPIEMVRSQAKRKYDEVVLQNHNPLEAWALALAVITPQQWTNYVEHTERLIFKYWTKEKFVTVNEIIINLSFKFGFR